MGAIRQLNSRLYSDYLKLAQMPGKGPGYLCRNRKTGNYAVFFACKDGPYPLPHYTRLSLRDIVHVGIRLKNELRTQPEDASFVSKELQRMSAHLDAKEAKRNILIRLAHKIFDCVRNLFAGLGWKTTARQARQLGHELVANLPTPLPAPLPATLAPLLAEAARAPNSMQNAAASAPMQAAAGSSALVSAKRAFSKEPAVASYSLQTKVPASHNQKAAMETYKTNPANCTLQDKMTIWLNIGKFEPTTKEIATKQIASVKMLMEHMSVSRKIDLNDKGCAHVIVDSFRLCNKTTTSEMALWLTKQRSFSAALIGQCLEALSERAKAKPPTDAHALFLLLKHYSTQKWNHHLPCSSHQVVKAVVTLLLEDHNAPNTIAMVNWMVDQKEFDVGALADLTQVFVLKAAYNPATAFNTRFDALNHLVDWYKKNQGVMQQLQVKNPGVANHLAAF